MRMTTLLLGLALPTLAQAKASFNYPYDSEPLKRHPKEAAEIQALRDEGTIKPSTHAQLKRHFELLEAVSNAEPAWIDGYWKLGEAAFQYGNSLTDPKDRELARGILVKGQIATETCLKKEPANALCKMFLGAAMGKIASIDGVFSSLKKAETIETLWTDVVKSGVNFELAPHISLQGSARYALGIFYRLVPDSIILKWMFGTKGDIQKSIELHQASVDEDGPNACNLMMLGVAQLCSVKGDAKSQVGKAGLENLAKAKSFPMSSSLAKTCLLDIPVIEKDTSLACGYEPSRQQEEKTDDELKKLSAGR